VVATGSNDKRTPRQERPGFREPIGEPRVRRVAIPSRVGEVDVPEYIPRY
jgi:hypothetical protein